MRVLFLVVILLALPGCGPAVPPAPGLDPFYKKHLSASGLPIVSSEKVPDAALLEAEAIVVRMTSKRADVLEAMIARKTRVAIMAKTEVTTDIPEHRDLNTAFPQTDWNRRCRGVGATLVRPACSGTEENLLQLDEDRYHGESILIHEFGHTMLVMGLDAIEPTFRADLSAAYEDAMARGLFKNTYAATNADEYWAEGVQDWFDANLTAKPADGIHNEIGTRAELKTYDPALATLLERVFGNDEWRWRPGRRKTQGLLTQPRSQRPMHRVDCGDVRGHREDEARSIRSAVRPVERRQLLRSFAGLVRPSRTGSLPSP